MRNSEGLDVYLPKDFNEFLRDTVNINTARLTALESNIEALEHFIKQQDWGTTVLSSYPQGSWAHQTIIKPVDGGEFDADLLVMVDPVKDWTAKTYVDELYRCFRGSDLYRDKVQLFSHCVTVTYVGDRKVDIAPCVKDRAWTGTYEVCNRETDLFERSAPIEFTQWLKEKNGYSGGNSFRKVTRLLKYLRDIKGRFTCPSILLTTLIGARIEWLDKRSDDFADVPKTLRTIMGRLDDWLQAHPTKPRIENPKLSTEDFAAELSGPQYDNLRTMIHKYRGWVDEACEAQTRAESIRAWRRLFGDDFAKGEDVAALAIKAESGLLTARSLVLSTAAHFETLVDEVISFGRAILPSAFYTPPYQRTPPWRTVGALSDQVHVTVAHHASRQSDIGRAIRRGEALPRSGGLWFKAYANDGSPIPDGFRVEWRITNTGAEALMSGAGRGGFYHSERTHSRWEALQYRGVHLAEAFVVRNSDETLVAKSEPFEVVIQ